MSRLTLEYVSPSQLNDFSCRLLWKWAHIDGYVPKRKSLALELGYGVHQALEGLYRNRKDPVLAFKIWARKRFNEIEPQWDEQTESLDEAKALGIEMLRNYMREYKDDFQKFKVLAVEKTASRPFPDYLGNTNAFAHGRLLCRVDALVEERRTGLLFVMEHKTFSSFSAAFLDRDDQMTAEIWCARALPERPADKKIAGVLYNGLRKQEAKRMKKGGPPLFERHKIFRTQAHIQNFLSYAYVTYCEMTSRDLVIFPHPNLVRCSQCSFKEPCLEYLRGGDYKFILNHLFTRREAQNAHKA